MTENLTGISALLQSKIDRLEVEAEWFANSGVPGLGDIQPERAQQLAQLRQELKLELETKRVVVLGTVHELQRMPHARNAELRSRLAFLIEKFAVTTVMEEWTVSEKQSFASEFAKEGIAYKDVGDLPPENSAIVNWSSLCSVKERTIDEEEPVQGRADYRDLEAA